MKSPLKACRFNEELMNIETLLKTNVNDHTEKKANLTYLSWAWAWAEALKADPKATYKVEMFDGKCYMNINGTFMVWVTVTIFEKPMTCQLPVMDHRNKAIPNPDAFQVNTAIMRCMTKALSLHGLGLYIYAGEDLPEDEANVKEKEKPQSEVIKISAREALKDEYDSLTTDRQKVVDEVVNSTTDRFNADDIIGAYDEYTGLAEGSERMGAWYFLPSNVRSAITKHKDSLKQKEAA